MVVTEARGSKHLLSLRCCVHVGFSGINDGHLTHARTAALRDSCRIFHAWDERKWKKAVPDFIPIFGPDSPCFDFPPYIVSMGRLNLILAAFSIKSIFLFYRFAPPLFLPSPYITLVSCITILLIFSPSPNLSLNSRLLILLCVSPSRHCSREWSVEFTPPGGSFPMHDHWRQIGGQD